MHKGLLFCGIAVPISNVAKGVLSRNQKDDMVNDLVFGLVYTLVLVLSPIMHDSWTPTRSNPAGCFGATAISLFPRYLHVY